MSHPQSMQNHAVRFIHGGKCRTYLLQDLSTCDAICTALDLLEQDVPDITSAIGLAVVAKAWDEGGAALADDSVGPVVDIRPPLERVAA